MSNELPEGTDHVVDSTSASDIAVASGATAKSAASEATGKAKAAASKLKDEAARLSSTAGEKARGYADAGKDKATDALDNFSTMLRDAAGSVDERLGSQYGDYARKAADSLASFSDNVRNKDVDDFVNGARDLVRKSPVVAIGAAAALGFVIARLLKSGGDNNDSAA